MRMLYCNANTNPTTVSPLLGEKHFADCEIWWDSCCYGCRLRASPWASLLADSNWTENVHLASVRARGGTKTAPCEIPGFSALRLEHLMSNSNILLSNSNPCRLYSSAMTKRGCHVSSLCVTCWCFSSSWFTCDFQPHGALSPPIAKSFWPYVQGVSSFYFISRIPKKNSKPPASAAAPVCSIKLLSKPHKLSLHFCAWFHHECHPLLCSEAIKCALE